MAEHLGSGRELLKVDALEVTTLVDNTVDILMAGAEGVKRFALGKGKKVGPAPIAEHGVSFLVRTFIKGETHAVLMDAGLSPKVLRHNLETMELDLKEVEAVFLSHGHFDHWVGLKALRGRLRRGIPFVMHPHSFLERKVKPRGAPERLMPRLDEGELRAMGAEIFKAKEPCLIAGGTLMTTGEIKRRTPFEKGFPIHYSKMGGRWRKDPAILDDQSLIVNLKRKGLVVVAGCAHSGIINTILQARELTGEKSLHAVIGGFHLTGKLFEGQIAPTVRRLKRLKPRRLIPSHCTGWRAAHEIARAMPRAFIPQSVGTTFSF